MDWPLSGGRVADRCSRSSILIPLFVVRDDDVGCIVRQGLDQGQHRYNILIQNDRPKLVQLRPILVLTTPGDLADVPSFAFLVHGVFYTDTEIRN